jgi:hypothetical protein
VFSGEQKLSASDYEKINSWVANDLSSSNAEWKIVVMHNPVYSLVSDTVSTAVKRAQLFEAGGVSLILCGHQHVYCRSFQLTEGSIDYDNGITQIMGNASWKEYSSDDDSLMEKTESNISNYQVIHINGDSLTVQSYDSSTGTRIFSPDADMTRAMFGTVLGRLAKADQTSAESTTFTDVDKSSWYASYVEWASSKEIVGGITSDSFAPDQAVTREQLIAILYRYAKTEGMSVTVLDNAGLNAFSDSAKISSWASDAFLRAADKGIISGNTGVLDPQGYATRAQVAQIIFNFCQKYQLDGGKA